MNEIFARYFVDRSQTRSTLVPDVKDFHLKRQLVTSGAISLFLRPLFKRHAKRPHRFDIKPAVFAVPKADAVPDFPLRCMWCREYLVRHFHLFPQL